MLFCRPRTTCHNGREASNSSRSYRSWVFSRSLFGLSGRFRREDVMREVVSPEVGRAEIGEGHLGAFVPGLAHEVGQGGSGIAGCRREASGGSAALSCALSMASRSRTGVPDAWRVPGVASGPLMDCCDWHARVASGWSIPPRIRRRTIPAWARSVSA